MALPAEQKDENVKAASPAQPKEESQLSAIWRRFKRNKLAMTGLIVLGLLYLVAFFAPYLAAEDIEFVDVTRRNLKPTWDHIMGTDYLGRDVLSRMIWGSRVSLTVGFVAMGMAVSIGTVVGAIAGFYGGTWIDIVLMRIAEAIDVIPVFYLLIAILALFPGGLLTIMFIIGITSWPSLAMIVRGQFLSLRERDYTQASRALGARDARLIFRHILPNAMAPIIVSATLRIGGAIITESSLSFLGLGVKQPSVSWGQMLSLGRSYLRQAPWVVMYPGLAILITVLSFNFIGDGLRDALDPKMKR